MCPFPDRKGRTWTQGRFVRFDDFLAIKDAYIRSAARCPDFSPFYSHRWLAAVWRNLRESEAARIWCLYAGDELEIAIPFKFRRERHLGIGVPTGSLMGIHAAPLDLPATGTPDGWEQALASWLCSDRLPGWIALRLGPLNGDQAAGDSLLRALEERRLPVKPARTRFQRLDLAGTWDEFLRSQSKHFRHNLRTKEKDAFVKCGLTLERVKNPTIGVPRDTVFRVSELSWQGQQGVAVSSTEAGRRFYECLAGVGGEFDLDLTAVRDGDRCVACLLGAVEGGIYHAFDQGFDPAYAKHSIGYVALWCTIKALFEEGVGTFDYGPDDPYKHRYDFPWQDASMLVVFKNRGVAAAARLRDLLASRGGLRPRRGPDAPASGASGA